MFSLDRSHLVPLGDIEPPHLRRLVDYWWSLEVDGLPSLADLDARRIQVEPGRVHLLRVEGPNRFRFLHYGATVTNPDARDMSGLTTADYEDKAFGALVTAHYQEAVDARQPVCRRVSAHWNAADYDYIRLTMPFGLHRQRVEFLIVCTHRIAVPGALERPPGPSPDPAVLRDTMERSRRLAAQIHGHEIGVGLEGIAAAAELRFAESVELAVRRGREDDASLQPIEE